MRHRYYPFSSLEWRLYDIASSIGKRSLFYKAYYLAKSQRTDLKTFRNIHKGQRCFILGGGPSLLKIDPELLKHEITFGVNCVFLIYDWLRFHPTYYSVEDWLVYEDRFENIKKYVTRSRCFFPLQFLTEGFHRKNNSYFRAMYDFDMKEGWPNFSRNAGKLVWIGGTVSYVCMQLAYYMGFSKVYLIGFDHNYTKPDNVITDGTEWTSQGDDPNHFHPAYFGKGKRWHDPRVDRMEMAYKKAKIYFEKDGRKICNATVGGCLEVFDRVDYRTLF